MECFALLALAAAFSVLAAVSSPVRAFEVARRLGFVSPSAAEAGAASGLLASMRGQLAIARTSLSRGSMTIAVAPFGL